MTFGPSTQKLRPSNGLRLKLKELSQLQEIITQPLCATKEPRAVWWSFMAVGLPINKAWMILGAWEGIETANGIGFKLQPRTPVSNHQADSNINQPSSVPWWLFRAEELEVSKKEFNLKYTTLRHQLGKNSTQSLGLDTRPGSTGKACMCTGGSSNQLQPHLAQISPS